MNPLNLRQLRAGLDLGLLLSLVTCCPPTLYAGTQPIRGFADLHVHQFNYLGFGGKAFVGAAYGPIETALPHCDTMPGDPFDVVHGAGGIADLLGATMRIEADLPIKIGHPTGGYPEFNGWPRWDSYTHQGVYEDWLRRALDGGLRLMVMLAGNSKFACGSVPSAPGRTCNDMEAVDLEIQAAKAMQAAIDDRCGGPGCGWYRIVTSPQEARQVINEGKLAVVLGIEVDSLFGCGIDDHCMQEYVLAQLQRYYDLGVRHFFPIHFDSNCFGGSALYQPLTRAAFSAPAAAYLVIDGYDSGYRYYHPRYPFTVDGEVARAPVNALGLTELGAFFVRELMRKKLIIDVNHMSARAVTATLDMVEQYNYPVVGGHCWFLDISQGSARHEAAVRQEHLARIRDLGGIAGIILEQGGTNDIITYRGAQWVVEHACGKTSESVAQAYLYAVQQMQGGPVALGSDFNGFAGLPGPRFGAEACPGGGEPPPAATMLQYPFIAAATGLSLDRSIVGQKTFDFNFDGLAHIGLLPDMIADLQNQFGDPAALEPLLNSAEGYITMWEKIESSRFGIYVVPPSGCPLCGDGSAGNPYQDLQLAVAVARPGEYVYLSPGTYPGIPVPVNKPLTLTTWPGRVGPASIGN